MITEERNEAIVPGQRVDVVFLSDSMDEIVCKLSNYSMTWEELPLHRVLQAGPYKVWFDKATGKACQISVGKGFQGLFLSSVGIGGTLRALKNVAGSLRDENGAYHVDRYPGICFELEDVDDWAEETAPIEFITIFPVEG